MTGVEIKTMIKNSGIFVGEVIRELGVSDTTFYRKLRSGFSNEEIILIKEIIEDLKYDKQNMH